MSRKIFIAVVVGLAIAALGAPSTAVASPEQRMLDAIDRTRQAHGLAPLRDSGTLSRSAESYSSHMLRSGFFGHRARISVPGNWSHVGENLAMTLGGGPSVGTVLRGWLRSPAHRRVLLGPVYRAAGVGCVQGRFRGRRATAWTLHVGKPGRGSGRRHRS